MKEKPQPSTKEAHYGEPIPLWTEEEIKEAFAKELPNIDAFKDTDVPIIKRRINLEGDKVQAVLTYMSPETFTDRQSESDIFVPILVPGIRFEAVLDVDHTPRPVVPLLSLVFVNEDDNIKDKEVGYRVQTFYPDYSGWNGVFITDERGDLDYFGAKVGDKIKPDQIVPADPKVLGTMQVTFIK